MTSGMLDSKPVFQARLISAGLDEPTCQRLIQGGVDTLAKLAFLATVSPATGDDTVLMQELVTVMNYTEHDPMPTVVKSILRRLWFESHATAISEVKNKLESGQDSAPRRLPLPEREDRRVKQQTRLVGLKIEGVHEPSHSLIDLIHTMREDEQVRYISPEQCTHREAELGGSKKEVFMQSDSGGRLKQINREIPPEADVSSSYKLRLALQRRSLGLDQMQLMTYECSESYHEYLFDLLLQVPPPNFQAISIAQILQADKAVWTFLATHCRSGISRRPDGSLPMETSLDQALRSPLIVAALQPLPKTTSFDSSNRWINRKGSGKDSDKGRSFTSRSLFSNPYSSKGGGKGKKGNKGKGKAPSAFLPKGLTGKNTTSDGSRICFGYNLGTCQQAKPGASCSKGVHICCNCESTDHSFANCPKRS